MRLLKILEIIWGGLLAVIFLKPILAFCIWQEKREEERPQVKKTARSNEDYTDEAKVLLEIGLIDPSDSRAATYPLDPALIEAVRSEITSLREMKRRYQCFQSLLGCHVEKQDQQQIHS